MNPTNNDFLPGGAEEIPLPDSFADDEPEGDETDSPGPDLAPMKGGLGSVGGVLTALYSKEGARQYATPPPRLRAAVTGAKLEPYTCLECGTVCEYNPDPAVSGSGPLTFQRRPPCVCEVGRDRKNEVAAAVRSETARQGRARAALVTAERALVLPPRLSACTFDNYDGDRHKAMKAALIEVRFFTEHAARFFAARRGTWELLPEDLRAAGIPNASQVALAPLLVSPPGRGKSHLAAASLSVLSRYGVLCRFLNCGDWIEQVRKQEIGGSGAGELLKAAQDADVLALDDMGMEHFAATNPTWGQTVLYRLINHRYERGLATIGTTMLKPDKLTLHYGERGPAIISRLTVGPWLSIPGAAPDGRSYGRTQAGGSLEAGLV